MREIVSIIYDNIWEKTVNAEKPIIDDWGLSSPSLKAIKEQATHEERILF